MFIYFGDVAFNLTNSTKIEKHGREIIVRYAPINEKTSGHCESHYFPNEERCSLAWEAMKAQIQEFNKKNEKSLDKRPKV